MMYALFLGLPLLLIAAAVWLLARARGRENEEGFAERVGQLGTGEVVDELAGLRNLQKIGNPVTRSICRRFWAAGIDLAPASANIGLVLAIVLSALVIFVSPLIGVLLVAAALLGIYLFLTARVNARRRHIMEQLPDYLEYVMRSLTAGNTLEEALESAALESTDPCRSLFLSVSRQVRLGASVEGTLGEAADVHRLRALHILAMSARVNRRFGGSMRRVVKSLIDTIRQQEAAANELKALTGETRFSAYVVAAIPILIAGFVFLRNPGYYTEFLASTGGRVAIIIAIGLQVLGLVIIWRMMASMREGEL